MSHIAIFGATGLTGSYLLKYALNDPNIEKVTTFTRRAIAETDAKLNQHQVDFSQLEQLQPALAVDTVFCCLGTTLKKAGSKAAFRAIDIDLVERVARVAKQAGTKQFVVISSQGASPQSKFFYSRCKAEIEYKLSVLFDNSECQLIICQPSLLLGERSEHRFAEGLGITFNKYCAWIWRGVLRKYQPILAADLAEAMLNLAKACRVPRMVVDNRNLHNVVATNHKLRNTQK